MGKRETISLVDYTKQFSHPNADLPSKWIYINGEKTDYKIRTDGAVISFKQANYDKTSKEPHILCGGVDSDGYHLVTLHHNYKYFTRKVHRLVAEAFIPNPKNLSIVNHINGDKLDNDISNLEWVDTYDNVHHAMDHDLRVATNNEFMVEKCCMLLETGEYSVKEISNLTGMTCANVMKIRNGTHWRKISEKYNFKTDI